MTKLRQKLGLLIMRVWVAIGVLSLNVSLSLAAGLPKPATHSTFPDIDMAQALLGRELFYDPILSGNRDIACATCHHPSLGTSDGMSLSIGTGGTGLGPDRRLASGQIPEHRVPRNAPSLWNLGAHDVDVLFHDGRLFMDPTAPFGIKMPGGFDLPAPVASILAAQAMLPVTSTVEMAGRPGENSVADALSEKDAQKAWGILAQRVQDIPAYRRRLDGIIGADQQVAVTDIANALAAFMAFEFRATNSAFDAFLNGDTAALTDAETRGMDLFYTDAGCSTCHSGLFQTDRSFHAIGVPQLGPGKGNPLAPYADFGRLSVTGTPDDIYRFITPSLRNVALTGPYGHSGAFATLDAMIRHHLAPTDSLMSYDRDQAVLHDLPFNDWQALEDEVELFEIAAAIELPSLDLTDAQIADITAFLHALTDHGAANGRLGIPQTVPSRLPIDQ